MSRPLAASFDATAARYDAARRQLIPCFDAFYGAAVEAAGLPREAEILMVDLGAGTGLLTARLLDAVPKARAILMDVSEGMLDIARSRFAGRRGVEVRLADYATRPLPAPADLIVSALSIHHLENPAKQALFRRVRAALRPGGRFVNAEQVLGRTPEEEAYFHSDWLSRVRAAGVGETDLAAALERMRHDRAAPLADQLGWLREAGFAEVGCRFQDNRFAVYSGRRPPLSADTAA